MRAERVTSTLEDLCQATERGLAAGVGRFTPSRFRRFWRLFVAFGTRVTAESVSCSVPTWVQGCQGLAVAECGPAAGR